MGYMGFGIRKQDYTRKPKRMFNKLKTLYGEELEYLRVDDGHVHKPIKSKELTKEQRKALKEIVKRRLRRNQSMRAIRLYVTLVLTASFMAGFYYLLKYMFTS